MLKAWLSVAVVFLAMNGDKELSDEELRRTLESRFNWLDTNRDGSVDLPEMKAGFGVPLLTH